jgi:cathepsin L
LKLVALLCLVFASAFAIFSVRSNPELEFLRWMHLHGKSYDAEEFPHRYATFRANLNFIRKHNANPSKTFEVAMNKFGDLTNEEFGRLYLGTKINVTSKVIHRPLPLLKLPATWDWRKNGPVSGGVVTPVKNQAQCGSCWAFSTTGSVEGCHALATQTVVSLSEQNLMDCSTSEGNQGCNGGLMTQAMDYIISNGGIDTESSYPYTAQDGTCSYNSANSGSTLKSYVNVNSGDEADLLIKASTGPTSVAIDASQSSFQFYSSGIYSDPNCSTSQLDHGVLVIGWGNGYWLVKNSWGSDWGMSGFIEMARNSGNMCGIATMATLPQGCN